MKKLSLFLLAVLLSWPLTAVAGTIVCDPQEGVEYYLIDGLPAVVAATTRIPAQSDGSIALVIDALPAKIAVFTIKAKACVMEDCSEWSAPFVFTWPSPRPWANPRIRK